MSPITRALLVIVKASAPLTSRELADAIGIDYRKNFNKREAKYARKLDGFILRRKQVDARTSRFVLHWQLADRWWGKPLDEVIEAFKAVHP